MKVQIRLIGADTTLQKDLDYGSAFLNVDQLARVMEAVAAAALKAIGEVGKK